LRNLPQHLRESSQDSIQIKAVPAQERQIRAAHSLPLHKSGQSLDYQKERGEVIKAMNAILNTAGHEQLLNQDDRFAGSQEQIETLGVASSDDVDAISNTKVLEDLVDSTQDGIALDTLAPFDTISVQTRNSNYRIFLLDPTTGRALVEGGRHFVEPVEALVNGSTHNGVTFRLGWIGIGMRLELITHGKIASTSPVQSFHIEKSSQPV
jgi:hypothetical protein